jgi:hypothetical protein
MKKGGKPRILLYDLETSPYIGFTWGPKWEANIIEFIAERQIISIAWKFLGEKKVHVKALPDFPEYKTNPKSNKQLMQFIHELFEEADITVGHNVIDFDDKVANTDFLIHKLTPPPPHKRVDTLKILRAIFAFASNKLDDACVRLGIGKKVPHPGFKMWLGCLNGEAWAWALLKKYNRGDVILLEKLYLRLRPWAAQHPSMIPTDRAVFACPKCESSHLQGRGFIRTTTGERQRFQCQECGAWFTGVSVKKELRIR